MFSGENENCIGGKTCNKTRGQKTCVVHIKNLNQELKNGFKLKKEDWVIRSEKRYWVKPYIILNTKLKTQLQGMSLRKIFSPYEQWRF